MIMLHVVNYRGCQIHGSAPFVRAKSGWVFFEGGAYADTTDGTVDGPVRFVAGGEEGYVAPGPVGAEIVVTDVMDDGRVITRTARGSSAVSADGKYTVNLGDPDGACRGVQLGDGNVQINRF
jgi:hypothetical protein